jgi:hypothetical protein
MLRLLRLFAPGSLPADTLKTMQLIKHIELLEPSELCEPRELLKLPWLLMLFDGYGQNGYNLEASKAP